MLPKGWASDPILDCIISSFVLKPLIGLLAVLTRDLGLEKDINAKRVMKMKRSPHSDQAAEMRAEKAE